jgi:hypothetical protein
VRQDIDPNVFDDGLNGDPTAANTVFVDFSIIYQGEAKNTEGLYEVQPRIYAASYPDIYADMESFTVQVADPCTQYEFPLWCIEQGYRNPADL